MSKTSSPNNGDGAGYEVGYGKPPKHTRFKPGQSGNPRGRHKGVRNFGTDVKATLKASVKVTRDGTPRRVSTQEAMLLRLREKALNGDARALDRLINLAQTYNNEETSATAASLGTDDAMLLEIFRARVSSGAAGGGPSTDDHAGDGEAAGDVTHSVAIDETTDRDDVTPNPPRASDVPESKDASGDEGGLS